MTLLEAYEAIVLRGASAALAPRVAELRALFEARTGKFTPEDAWFEARSRAFWDDAITRQGFAVEAARGDATLSEEVRALAPAFARAHRGLFVIEAQSIRSLRDVWSGAEFLVDEIDDGMRDALAAASAPFDARVVGVAGAGAMRDGAPRVALLPGAVFHPADAIEPIDAVLKAARQQGMTTDGTLDALLRMERALRSLSRMKAGYAYRASALAASKHE